MKARTIVETEGPNPEFSHAAYHAACAAGTVYPVPHTLRYPPGRELDDRQAWILCIPGHANAKPVAEPADDECRAKVERWMTQRRARLGVLAAAVAAADAGHITDQTAKGHVEALADAYKEELPPRKKSKEKT